MSIRRAAGGVIGCHHSLGPVNRIHDVHQVVDDEHRSFARQSCITIEGLVVGGCTVGIIRQGHHQALGNRCPGICIARTRWHGGIGVVVGGVGTSLEEGQVVRFSFRNDLGD